MSEVINLGELTMKGEHLHPKQLLEIIIKHIDNGNINPNKILIITLEDTDNKFKTKWYQCQMKPIECVSLCEIAKTRFCNIILGITSL